MPYTPHTWVTGETITATKLNNLETQYTEAMTPATGSVPGVVSISAQTFAGLKTFSSGLASTTGTFSSTLDVTGAMTAGDTANVRFGRSSGGTTNANILFLYSDTLAKFQFRNATTVKASVEVDTNGGMITKVANSTGTFNVRNLSDGSLFEVSNAGSAYLNSFLTMGGPVNMKSYTVLTLPSAATAGATIYVSDASGSPCLAFSNGSVWKRCDDATVTVS